MPPAASGNTAGYTELRPSRAYQSVLYTPIPMYDPAETRTDEALLESSPRSTSKTESDPVYVRKTADGEILAYNSRLMTDGNKYEIDWNGEHFILIKDGPHVDFYKFFPDP